jgi:hypothetical protein
MGIPASMMACQLRETRCCERLLAGVHTKTVFCRGDQNNHHLQLSGLSLLGRQASHRDFIRLKHVVHLLLRFLL